MEHHPEVFIIEDGPMGGLSIVRVGNNAEDALRFVTDNPQRDLTVYAKVNAD